MDWTDKTRPIREGETFDADRVLVFLRNTIPGLEGPVDVAQFPGGHSNLTYLIRARDREFVFRRPPFGRKAKTAHDMGREYRILKILKPVFPFCPAPLAYTDDESIVGSPFFVMERIRGIILRRDLPNGLAFTPEQARRLCERFVHVLASLHRLDYQAIGLGQFGKPDGYVRRQIEGWTSRYRAVRTDDAPDFEAVMAWLADRIPGESAHISVIHNDYRFDNLVLSPEDPLAITGVLDWEMATIGDPLMDLGGALAYWIDRDDPADMQAIRMVPTTIPGMMSRREIVRCYAEMSSIPVDRLDFYYCFGLFRLAVIAQQIYYRYHLGQTRDERFKMMIVAVHVLDAAAKRVIARSDI